MVEKFPMEEEEIFFFILNLKMWGFLTYMRKTGINLEWLAPLKNLWLPLVADWW